MSMHVLSRPLILFQAILSAITDLTSRDIVGSASATLTCCHWHIQRSMHGYDIFWGRKSSPPRILLSGARRNASHRSAAEHRVRPCITLHKRCSG